MTLLIKSALAVLLFVTINGASAMNCKEDVSKWFLSNGAWTGDFEGKPDNQKLTIERDLKVFGESWTDGYKVKIRKGRATGEVRFQPSSGYRQPGAFAIRASRIHYNTSHLGHVRARMTTAERDIVEIEQIIKEAYPCLTTGNFRPNHAIVATYTCMLHISVEKERDTFQVVVAGNKERTFVIIQYHHLHEQHFIQFGFLERLGRNKHKFTKSRFDRAGELLHSTNGVVKGMWIFDITDKVPRTPELCPKEPNECTVTDHGLVHSFDGVTQVAPPEFLTVLASTQLDFEDECNFENRLHMENRGEVKFIEMFVGAITNANPEDRFYFTLDRKEGKITLRGPSLRRAEVLTFPYTFKDGSNTIVVRENAQGWKLKSEHCGYELVFRPDGQEPVYRLTVDESRYAGLLDGYCENFDGDITNDEVDYM